MVFSTVSWDTYIVAIEIHCSLSEVGSSELLPQVSWATDLPSPSQLMSPAELLKEMGLQTWSVASRHLSCCSWACVPYQTQTWTKVIS